MEPLRAVFFTDVSAGAAHIMDRWANAGHTVAACVVSPRPHPAKWRRDRPRQLLCPDFSMRAVLRRSGARLIKPPKDLKRADFLRDLALLRCDILISSCYPHRIPQDVLRVFRWGGVNLHPSMLPEYRGPHPVQAMAVDGTLRRYAGVTLHRISRGFDEGEIIAQTAASEADLLHPNQHALWCMRLAGDLVYHAVPQYCRNQRSSHAQPMGQVRYARLQASDFVLTDKMGVAALRERAQILGPMGQLRLSFGGRIFKIAGAAQAVGELGSPPNINRSFVEFDAADGRVCLKRAGHVERRFRAFSELLLLRQLRQQLDTKKAPTENLVGAA